MNTIPIQLFFSKSSPFSLQTLMKMHSLIHDLYDLRLYKNVVCRRSIFLSKGHYQNQIFSRALILLLLPDEFFDIKSEFSTHHTFNIWLILIFKMHLERSLYWDAIRHEKMAIWNCAFRMLTFHIGKKIKARYFVLIHIILNQITLIHEKLEI